MKTKKVKHLLALVMAGMMACSVAACGSTTSDSPSTEGSSAVEESETEEVSSVSTEAVSEVQETETEEEEITLESLKESLTLPVETDGLSAEEMLEKGKAYEAGDGVIQWYCLAKAYYEAAAEAGNEEASAAIDALTAFRDEFMANSPEGEGELYTFYRAGLAAGQDGNYEQAFAAAYDDIFFFEDPLYRGIGDLGSDFLNGKGVDQDVQKAVSLYRFYAEGLGNGKGYSSLGALYAAETGAYEGIEQSYDTAISYYELSYTDANLTNPDWKGPRYIGDFYDEGFTLDDGTVVEPDYATAVTYYQLAADGTDQSFDGTACYKLGVYYEEGREGVPQDYDLAATYYLKAISDEHTHNTMLGIPQTYLALGRFYENGTGVEANLDTAVEYYQKALEAAEENLNLADAAGNASAQAVYDEASEALERLK